MQRNCVNVFRYTYALTIICCFTAKDLTRSFAGETLKIPVHSNTRKRIRTMEFSQIHKHLMQFAKNTKRPDSGTSPGNLTSLPVSLSMNVIIRPVNPNVKRKSPH